MQAQRRTRALWTLALTVSPLFCSCGGDEEGLSGFAATYEAEIEYDCRESVLCLEADMATADSIPNCKNETADILNSDGQKQQEFLASFKACRCFRSCDYVNCASRPTLSFGEMQIDNIRLLCGEKVACAVARGGSLTACSCEQEWVNRLNVSVPAQRQAYGNAVTMCQGQAGCGYSDCFDTIYGVATGS